MAVAHAYTEEIRQSGRGDPLRITTDVDMFACINGTYTSVADNMSVKEVGAACAVEMGWVP
jgi:hypothetical protein